MPYQLVLSELKDEITRDVGENVFFNNLPSEYEVYIFYYPGAMPNVELESRLRNFGNITGKNLFVNIGRLNDPNYGKIRNKFNIMNLPVIIITASDFLASPPEEFSTAYVRIDNKKLLNSPDLMECIQRLFNMFIDKKISEALSQFKKDQRDVFVTNLKSIVNNTLKGVWTFLEERDVSVSLIEGKFELKKSGG